MTWVATAVAGGTAISGMMGANAQAGASRAAAKKADALNKARQKAYGQLIQRGTTDFQAGEQGFNKEANTALPELAMMKEDALKGGAEGLNQASAAMIANQAKTGQRGGQASGALARMAGEMGEKTQRGVNEMTYQEAAQRAAERRQYQSGKARAGQSATYTAPTF